MDFHCSQEDTNFLLSTMDPAFRQGNQGFLIKSMFFYWKSLLKSLVFWQIMCFSLENSTFLVEILELYQDLCLWIQRHLWPQRQRSWYSSRISTRKAEISEEKQRSYQKTKDLSIDFKWESNIDHCPHLSIIFCNHVKNIFQIVPGASLLLFHYVLSKM